MPATGSKMIEFRCGLGGVISKEAPDLLKNGQYRYLNNITTNQEGSISSRPGIKEIGYLTATEPTCYFIRKLVVAGGEDPFAPSINPRYLGILTSGGGRNIYRTTNYNSITPVASSVDTDATRHWEMAEYSAGESGTPWAYFACPTKMVKDWGTTPYATLPTWGITPAVGVALAAVVVGNVAITAIDSTTSGTVVTLVSEVGLSDFDQVTFTGTPGVTVTTTDGRTDLVAGSPWDIRIGIPDANGVTTNAATMFRLYDTNGQGIGLVGTYSGTGASVAGVPTQGNLDGGAESSDNRTQPYDWEFAYEETDTGDKGNPSQPMATSGSATLVDTGITYHCNPVAVHNGSVKVAVWGTGDARIGYIRVYRRGGMLYDTWRLVARVANPGAETHVIITDNTADAELVYAEQIETDNDPPVTSTVPSPIRSSVSSGISTGFQTVALSSSTFGPVLAGSLVHVIDPINSEDVYCSAATGSSFRAFFQFAHNAATPVEVDAISGQPCNLVTTYGESTLVAGDPNNPHMVYKSKTGKPQSFPVGTDMSGAVTSIGVGTPSNGVVNLTTCRGQVVTLNVSALYELAILGGSMREPVRVAAKGLKGQSAWCKSATEEIWYLSDDGVYSWDGAYSRKRTDAIDPVFHGRQYNGISPLDMSAAALTLARMEFRRGMVYLVYKDIAGHMRELVCEPTGEGDRWFGWDGGIYSSSEFPITMLYREPDTQSLIVAVNNPGSGVAVFGIADGVVVSGGVNLTSDWWTGSATTGNYISWDVKLPWFDMGAPTSQKLFEEVWLDIDPQLYHGIYTVDSSITVELLLNYSDTVVDTFEITIPTGNSLTGRQLISLLPNLVNTSGSIYQSYGRESRAISFHLSGHASPVQFALYSLFMQYQETGMLSAGSAADWMDLGSKHDKRVYQMSVVFETAGTDRHLVLETRGGREGKTAGTAQIFALSSPTDLGSGRCMKVFPLADPTVGKLFRVRPYASATLDGANVTSSIDLFRVLEVTFPDAEQYPPDIVSRVGAITNGNVTEPWTTGGYDWEKYANQIDFEVNTNNVAVTVQLQADGANIGSALTITSTDTDRKRNITLPTALKGKAWSAFVDPAQAALTSGAGMWQLFNMSWRFQQADKGEVGHTFAWDELGHPYDKELLNVAIEYDTTVGGPITLQLDTLSGIGGVTINTSVTTFLLGSGKGSTNYPIPADTVCKMVRVYPAGSVPVGYRQWKYTFSKIDYPADTVRVTAWKDATAPVDKEPSWLWIDADTSNVAATVKLQNENGDVMTVYHTGVSNDRKKNYAIPVDTHAKMWRLVSAEGVNGRFQLFDWGFERWQAFALTAPVDPPEIIYATPWSDFGYPFGKMARSLSLTLNTGGVTCSVALQTNEGGTVATFASVNTSYTTRRLNLATPANLQGTLWRLVFTPGSNGLAQLWDWSLDAVKMPPALTTWSSYGQAFGYHGFKFCFQYWMDYICGYSINVTFTSDTGSVTVTLPPHPVRAVERGLFSAVWGSGLDKSKLYGVSIVANSVVYPFQVFQDCSGIEWIPCGADRHAGLQQISLSEFMGVSI